MAIAGESIDAVATVPLEALLPVTMTLAFFDKNKSTGSIS
jgi:hypothetical protein